MKGALALPPVQKALDEAKEKASEQWEGLPKGGKVALISGAVAIGAGAVVGLATHPQVAKDLLKKLDGVEIPLPLPGVPGKFKVQILTNNEPPKFDPHAPPAPDKLQKPVGPGAVLKWEVKF